MKKRLTISQVADIVGVSTRTIKRWEVAGKTAKAKRDCRSWRVYDYQDVYELKKYHELLV